MTSKRQAPNQKALGRADCPLCGRRNVSLKRNGQLTPHRIPNWKPTDPWCDGYPKGDSDG